VNRVQLFCHVTLNVNTRCRLRKPDGAASAERAVADTFFWGTSAAVSVGWRVAAAAVTSCGALGRRARRRLVWGPLSARPLQTTTPLPPIPRYRHRRRPTAE